MYQCLGERCGEFGGTPVGSTVAVHESVGAHSPFEGDEGPVEDVGGVECGVEAAALVGEEPFVDLYAGLAEHGDATACHLRVGVAGGHYHAPEAALDEQFGARRCLAVVRAWLEGDVYGALREQGAVGVGDRAHGVDLGMRASETAVPAFAYYASVRCRYHCAYHWVGRYMACAGTGKGQCAAHVLGVVGREDHRAEYAGLNVSPPSGLPVLSPLVSHRTRCSERPWLKLSGISRPYALRWR